MTRTAVKGWSFEQEDELDDRSLSVCLAMFQRLVPDHSVLFMIRNLPQQRASIFETSHHRDHSVNWGDLMFELLLKDKKSLPDVVCAKRNLEFAERLSGLLDSSSELLQRDRLRERHTQLTRGS